MRIDIRLSDNYQGTRWYCDDKRSVFTKGYIVDPNDSSKYIDGRAFNNCIKSILSKESLSIELPSISGNFAIIAQLSDGKCIAAVDRQRSFPLLYWTDGETIIITDSLSNIAKSRKTINNEALLQFSRTICVYRENTAYNEVFQIKPAHYLDENTCGIKQIAYYTFRYCQKKNYTEENKIELLRMCYEKIFQRLIRYLNGRQVALPLSGGRDSRLILFYLMKFGYKNIITFSYGYEGTDDQRLSKIVADFFGANYHYVHCRRNKMRKMARRHFHKYIDFAGNGCSLPCVQELYAVYELREKGLIQDNCVFLPGHGGDFYAGARAVIVGGERPDEWRDSVVNHLFFKEYKYTNTALNESDRREEANQILSKHQIVPSTLQSKEEASECIEKYYFDERESKYIQNCVRYYDYWNYEWIAPFEDIILDELWLSFPLSDRVNRKLFHRFIETVYPRELLNIRFAGKPTTVLKLQWCYGFVPAVDYIKYRLFQSYASMNQFVWSKYVKRVLALENKGD